MNRLSDKVAIITGGAGGIGLAAANKFVAEGARVMLVDLDDAALAEAACGLGDSARWCAADVSDPDATQSYVRAAVDAFGGVDILLANAGIEGQVKPIVEQDVEMFDKVIAVNVRGVWLSLKYTIPEIAERGGGSIVITSSVAGIHGSPGVSPYVTSKHAVIGMMRSAALECAPLNIRVNTVNPSPIETRMMRSLEDGMMPGNAEQAHDVIAGTIPLGRYGEPGDVADLMCFLAGDEAQFLTGGVYMVDGGISAR